jgi:FHA domain/Domain of unknown function (DUF1707)
MRPSLTERERVADRLRGACAEDRLSVDTLSHRLEIVYTARSRDELEWLLADLPQPHALMRAAVTAVTAISRWSNRLEQAWREPRTTRFTLPFHERTIVGRSRSCGCIVADPTVSRAHAALSYADGSWSLRDLGSTNGTFVNGRRISGETEVKPGDEVAFGGARFVLA